MRVVLGVIAGLFPVCIFFFMLSAATPKATIQTVKMYDEWIEPSPWEVHSKRPRLGAVEK